MHLQTCKARRPKWLLLDWNLRVCRAAFLLEAVGETLFPCLHQLLEAVCTPWLGVLHPSHFCFCLHISSSDSVFLLPPYRDLCVYIGLTWDTQDNFPISRPLITSSKPFLPYKVTLLQISGIMMWASVGTIIQPSTLLTMKKSLY